MKLLLLILVGGAAAVGAVIVERDLRKAFAGWL